MVTAIERDLKSAPLSCANQIMLSGNFTASANGGVLVVDDDLDIREVFREFLLSKGYPVRVVPHGKAAIAALGETLPVAIVTDLNMPEMDGWELLHVLKSDSVLSRIPVAVMTAEERFPAGYLVLRKPFPPEALLDFLEQAHGRLAKIAADPPAVDQEG
jgi:CheY-like chemotaxis protein